MILETIRAVTDALNNEVYGVNARLVGIPLDAGDAAPPLVASIVDETRSDQAAVGRYPTIFPVLIVNQWQTAQYEGEVANFDYRDGQVSVLIRMIHEEANTAFGNSSELYTMRAIQQCIRQFLLNENDSARVRNGIQIISCLALEQVKVSENIIDATVSNGITAKFYVRDIQP